MRITNKILVQGYLSDLSNNLENMQRLEGQLSTGILVRKPSDDPFKAARVMEINTTISMYGRYKENMSEGQDWLKTTDLTLGQVGDVLKRVHDLVVQASNDTYDAPQRKSMAEEVSQLKEQLVQVGNTNFNGKYIFGGDKTTSAPFVENSGVVSYNGSTVGLVKEFSQGVKMDIATTGDKFQDIFATLDEIIGNLNAGNSPSANMDTLEDEQDNILDLRAKAGAMSNRLDAMVSKNDDENLNMTELLSKTQDVDIAQKVMEFNVAENVYVASLQTGAKVLQPSILDFLK
ncbi:MAG: flagellar hook-associated protein FlgL [Clostridiales bacterium]|nr:flagellar hook-associated protein FlgL [Clostridiales bacterium]HBM81524.1 flagellar hook-associated protein 3 [Clostridiaceae bacterium]